VRVRTALGERLAPVVKQHDARIVLAAGDAGRVERLPCRVVAWVEVADGHNKLAEKRVVFGKGVPELDHGVQASHGGRSQVGQEGLRAKRLSDADGVQAVKLRTRRPKTVSTAECQR
jgi:hypothetical protein